MNDQLFITPNKPINYRHFGSWLRQIRKKRGYTQGQVAMAVGKSVSWICEFEKGRRGLTMNKSQFYISLAEYLNVPLEAVLNAANIPKNKDDARVHSVYTMIRNKALSNRIVSTVDALQDTTDLINVASMDSSAKLRHLGQTLQIQLTDLKSALRLL
jgi:transcriptional regulator with XRE-family HTH domain